jgi:homoserine dehydrogenase
MKVKAGLVGFGTIGTGVVRLLGEQGQLLAKRSGVDISLERIVDVDLERGRGVDTGHALLSSRFEDIIEDPSIEIVIELVGGTTIAKEVVSRALRAGKHVVTANKALLYEYGEELFELAIDRQRELRYEASVAGGIPIIRAITESLAGDRITTIYGIVNGTTNFILTRMIQEQWSFEAALKRAQELGFAEADPTLDIDGSDARSKLAILASLAFRCRIDRSRIAKEGIQRIDLTDVLYAKELGYVVKLLAIAKETDGEVSLRVNPTLVPEKCALANVSNEFNAVMLQSRFLGDSLYVGRGAGANPTATAVVADVVDLAVGLVSKREFNANAYAPIHDYPTKSYLDTRSRFYLRLATEERAGILAVITKILGDHGISISAIIQKEAAGDQPIPIVLLTRQALERDLRAAVQAINELSFVHGPTVILHIEDIRL